MRHIYIAVILIFTLSSCSKWLDITPKDIILDRDMFILGEGHRNALNGIYRQLSYTSMYGKEMSWGMADVMGRMYRTGDGISVGHAYYNVANGIYDTSSEVKTMISGMWSNAYNTIANCNNLIDEVSKADPKIFKGNKLEQDMILGEALALRGFIHFDMLRFFGVAPIKGMDELSIPYFTKFKSLHEPQKSVKEILNLVIDDIKRGRDLVAPFDTLTVNEIDRKTWMDRNNRFSNNWGQTNLMPTDIFYGFRGYRMSYIAACAALARVYNYAGMHDLAKEEADKVIGYKAGDNLAFTFAIKATVASDRKLSSDLIFTLADNELYDNFIRYTSKDLYQIELLMDGSYTSNFDDNADYRKTELLTPNKKGNYYMYNKHMMPLVSGDNTEMVADMLPIIRLSELHYIAAEYYASKGDFENAKNSLDNVRAGRGCKKGILNITDITSFNNELIKEARREFSCEGQVFHYYKKLNILPKPTLSESAFVLPRPENETIN